MIQPPIQPPNAASEAHGAGDVQTTNQSEGAGTNQSQMAVMSSHDARAGT